MVMDNFGSFKLSRKWRPKVIDRINRLEQHLLSMWIWNTYVQYLNTVERGVKNKIKWDYVVTCQLSSHTYRENFHASCSWINLQGSQCGQDLSPTYILPCNWIVTEPCIDTELCHLNIVWEIIGSLSTASKSSSTYLPIVIGRNLDQRFILWTSK